MIVREVMSTDVATVTQSVTLDSAVRTLLERDIGSLIAVDSAGIPTGILTRADILRCLFERDETLSALTVADVEHAPAVTTTPETAVTTVARQMTDRGVKKVPVREDMDLVGIITLTDIVWHLSSLREEVAGVEALRRDWNAE